MSLYFPFQNFGTSFFETLKILSPSLRSSVRYGTRLGDLKENLGWRIHESVEDTKLSTNKQHSLSLVSFVFQLNTQHTRW